MCQICFELSASPQCTCIFSLEVSGDQDPQQVVRAGITDRGEVGKGTKLVEAGSWQSLSSAALRGELKSSDLPLCHCVSACSDSTAACVAAVAGTVLATMGTIRPLPYAKSSGKKTSRRGISVPEYFTAGLPLLLLHPAYYHAVSSNKGCFPINY